MAGGVKKPVNIFRLKNLGEPKEVFNRRLWLAILTFGLMGAARGIDEGLITGAFNSKDFQRYIHYDSYSRVWATRQLCLLWILGIAIFMGNGGSLGAVYAGRFIAGLGVGQTVVVGPVYLAEISPAPIRGLCTCVFTGFTYVGIVLAYFTNYGCQLVPTSLHIIFAGLIFILSFWQYESPRFLVKRGKLDKGLSTISRIRNLPPDHEYVETEFNSIIQALDAEKEASLGSGWLGILKETVLVPSNAYRLYLTCFGQVIAHWSGAGSITVYAPDLIKLLGITGTNENLLITALFGVVKLIAAIICTLFLVDVIGRKRSLLIGISLQAISMIYVAGFLTAVPQIGGSDDVVLTGSKKSANEGAIAMFYISGFGWALGWNSMQYLLTAELFPLRIRALATSAAMTLHFANQYGLSRAVPNMLVPASEGGIGPAGTFWFFAAVTLVGGLWVWFTGRTLESMEALFALPWYKIGRYGNRYAEEHDQALEKEDEDGKRPGSAKHVELETVEKV
ncbi:hypothetical protein PRZ48_008185 [Zasmidium cellare]|uniref:Major facilitator superfamily (MFS) profile domain-containing protein n=1 Tax=Zasmidium cellare TaxID=395010 RepID=A0ABR0EES2_ZASCE|nr:hypothetical protein PRZ48_008185 [Zasmidium cellare]